MLLGGDGGATRGVRRKRGDRRGRLPWGAPGRGAAGFAALALEIAAGRLMAPLVGVSLYTWTGVIGVVLAGLAAGNALGGGVTFPAVASLPGCAMRGKPALDRRVAGQRVEPEGPFVAIEIEGRRGPDALRPARPSSRGPGPETSPRPRAG